MNAHESEHVSVNESEVVLAFALGCANVVDPGCGSVLHLHVCVHGCAGHRL